MFGDLLRQFLNLCEVKMYVLAQTLEYDKTYLSKWINNVKLPPAKNIDSLAEQIAAVLVKQSSADAQIKLAASCGLVQNDGSRITPKAAGDQGRHAFERELLGDPKQPV